MNLNVDISKLPADVRKTYRRYQVMHAEKKIQNKAKNDFLSFVKCVWPDFIEGAHHRHVAEKFNKIVLNNGKSNHTKTKNISVNFVTPYAIPERENITIPQLLHPISAETANAFLNARVCPELLNH